MNQAILHVGVGAAPAPLPWPIDFSAHNLVLLRVSSLREAEFSLRAYGIILLLLDLPETGAQQAVAELTALAHPEGQAPIPILGIAPAQPTPEERTALLTAGLKVLLLRSDPPDFLRWQVDTLMLLRNLTQFEQTRFDVAELAKNTREQLHDLSQPLSAVYGRLQLLAAKCPPGDPHAAQFRELVDLTFAVTRHLMELQHMHRKYS